MSFVTGSATARSRVLHLLLHLMQLVCQAVILLLEVVLPLL